MRLLLYLLIPLFALVRLVLGPPRPCGRHANTEDSGVRALLELAQPSIAESTPNSEALATPRPQRPRPYVPPPRIPDYPAFCAVAEAHAARWEITYEHETEAPYQARHRAEGLVVSASDLEVFDELLRIAERPSHVRPYIDCVRTWEVAP